MENNEIYHDIPSGEITRLENHIFFCKSSCSSSINWAMASIAMLNSQMVYWNYVWKKVGLQWETLGL